MHGKHLLIDLRNDALSFLKEGLNAAAPDNFIPKNITFNKNLLIIKDLQNTSFEFDLANYKNVYIIGAGKVSSQMAAELEILLQNRITSGCVVTKYGFSKLLTKINVREAGHPLPDKKGFAASMEILDLLNKAEENDLIIFLISGGGSALLPYPVEGISLEDKILITNQLLTNGADIEDLNYVRKSISKFKGGGISAFAYPTKIIALFISDVVGDSFDTIASGPTSLFIPDFNELDRLLTKYDFHRKTIEKIKSAALKKTDLLSGVDFSNTTNIVLANNDLAMAGIRKAAESKNYRTIIIEEKIVGNVKEASEKYIRDINEIIDGLSRHEKVCVISGGETTVKVLGSGVGGRNSEFALHLLDKISGLDYSVLLSAGTDGDDGNSGNSGAVVDSESCILSQKNGINYNSFLVNNDSASFFKLLDSTVNTGQTNTNVMDLQIFLTAKK